ncbi:dde superfamily endonuclease [Holotrichia oblita]|uniref:Dde superfamily endonuclease n=1 Tax=Holotrichia oblita TaxID=644536 RepID=A0ACB9SLC2_HOLOL|nr:dde superfamily endonuclease [Holotrichia oblita]
MDKIKKLQQFIMYSAKIDNAVEVLKEDMSNSLYHVFGDHLNCSDRYCHDIGLVNSKLKEDLISSGLILYLVGLSWQQGTFQEATGNDIGQILLQEIELYQKRKCQRKKQKSNVYKRKREKNDENYGPNACQAPLNTIEFESEYSRILKSLQVFVVIFI